MIERFFPDDFVKKIEDINITELKEKGVKGLIIDIDNTLIDYDKNIHDETIEWIKNVKESGLKICLLSNNSKKHVDETALKLDVEGIHHAIKPRKRGFLNALKQMNLKNNEVAVVGDQVFTDVFGGNRLNMYTILVEQISIKDIWITKIKRPFEKYVLKKYFNSGNKQNI